jgi:hypothetical protein
MKSAGYREIAVVEAPAGGRVALITEKVEPKGASMRADSEY